MVPLAWMGLKVSAPDRLGLCLPQGPLLALHGWPQLIRSAVPCRRELYGKLLMEPMLGVSEAGPRHCTWPTSRGGTGPAGRSAAVTAALFASGSLCRSASGLATTLFLTDCIHLLKPKPRQDEAGSPWCASPLRKRSRVHHKWWTTKSPHSRHGSAPVGPPRLSTTAVKATFKLLILRQTLRGEDTKSPCYTPAMALAAWKRAATAGNHCLPLPHTSALTHLSRERCPAARRRLGLLLLLGACFRGAWCGGGSWLLPRKWRRQQQQQQQASAASLFSHYSDPGHETPSFPISFLIFILIFFILKCLRRTR